MTIKEFHDSIRTMLNIGQAQHYTPEQIDAQIHNAVMDLYRKEYEHFESSMKISDKLGYFKSNELLTLDENNQASLPEDYMHMQSPVFDAIFVSSEYSGKILKTSVYNKRKNSVAFAPSLSYPLGCLVGDRKIEVLPTSMTKARIYYLRKPVACKYAYSISQDGYSFVYDESNSVQIDWPEIDHPKIQNKVLTYLGISLRDGALGNQERIIIGNNEGA